MVGCGDGFETFEIISGSSRHNSKLSDYSWRLPLFSLELNISLGYSNLAINPHLLQLSQDFKSCHTTRTTSEPGPQVPLTAFNLGQRFTTRAFPDLVIQYGIRKVSYLSML